MDMNEFFTRTSELKEDCKIAPIINKYSTKAKNPDSQYKGVVFWYSIMFRNDINVERNGKRIVGINIMPYQITREDIQKAKLKSTDFNKTPNEYVDFDSISGNFHKHIYNGIQITLLASDTKGDYGIGLFDNKDELINLYETDNKDKKNEYADKVKQANVLYPNIDDNKTKINYDNLKEAVYKILEELKVIGK